MNQSSTQELSARIEQLRERIATARDRSAYLEKHDEVTIVAVTKYVRADDNFLLQLYECGLRAWGESRPQELIAKAETFSALDIPKISDIEWHLIGSLQRNKIRKVLPRVALIHSLDSVKLAEAIDRIAAEESIKEVRVLVEINISGDNDKSGFSPEQIESTWDELLRFERLRIAGVMSMSGKNSIPIEIRREFAATRNLRNHLAKNSPHPLPILSMGMSDDFAIAIEEGSTLIRIGSLLYSAG